MSKNRVRNTALSLVLSFGAFACTVPAVAHASRLQEHHEEMGVEHNDHPEYYKNRYYRMGNKEGWEDHQRNVQRKEHNHRFHSDDDRRAHDYGYQQGWSGTRWNDRH